MRARHLRIATWTNVAVGVYAIKAVATDNEGATGASAPITIEVKHPFGGHILTPTNGQVFVLEEQIRITASTTNGEGAVSLRYEFNGYNYPGVPDLAEPPYEFFTTASLGRLSISGLAVQESWNPSPYAALRPVRIHVIPARGFPVITGQPTNQLVEAGTNVVLSVSAFAELPVAYQWRFNGVNIPNATNEQLLLPNARAEQIGTYSVLVSTAAGSLPSNPALLDVWRPAAGRVLFANRFITNGAVLVDWPVTLPEFKALIYAGPRPDAMVLIAPALTSSNAYYFDGGAPSVQTDGGTAYVRVTVVGVFDGRQEWLVSDLTIQTAGTNAPAPLLGLALLPPATRPLTPDPYFARDRDWFELGVLGGELTLQAHVDSYAQRLSYQWQKDGQDIPGAAGECVRTSPYYPIHCSARLRLTHLQVADAAAYRLRVDTGWTRAVSPAALLWLVEPAGGRFAGLTIRDGIWRAQFHGRPGQQYFIQFSTNLRDWATVSTVTNVDGRVAVDVTPASSPDKGFYRAMLIP